MSSLVAESMDKPVYKRVVFGKYIVSDPFICHGKPTFKGTRKLVHRLIEGFSMGWNIEQMTVQYEVPREAIEEALSLAAEAILQQYEVPCPEPDVLHEVKESQEVLETVSPGENR